MDDSSTAAQARGLLARMLAPSPAETIADGLRGVSGPITMLKLHIAAGAPKLAIPDGALTGFYVVDDAGSTIGELILWIEDGHPSTLE